MDVDRLLSLIKLGDLILKLTNTRDCAFKRFLYEDSLLRMHTLIVTLLELAINVDVFDIRLKLNKRNEYARKVGFVKLKDGSKSQV